MELKTRRVHFAGLTTNPNEAWMKQIAKNLTAYDGSFCPAFRNLLQDEGVKPVRLPPRSPNLNLHLERFFGSLKSECLDRMIFFGEASLRRAVSEFLAHFHSERNHQGLANKLIEPGGEVGQTDGDIECRERLGGMLRYYHRRAG